MKVAPRQAASPAGDIVTQKLPEMLEHTTVGPGSGGGGSGQSNAGSYAEGDGKGAGGDSGGVHPSSVTHCINAVGGLHSYQEMGLPGSGIKKSPT